MADEASHPPIERRAHPPVPDSASALLLALAKSQELHQESQRLLIEFGKDFKNHIDDEPAMIANAIKEGVMQIAKEAFPDSNMMHHREWHERGIKASRQRSTTLNSLLFEVGKWATVAACSWVCYSLWQAFIRGPAT